MVELNGSRGAPVRDRPRLAALIQNPHVHGRRGNVLIAETFVVDPDDSAPHDKPFVRVGVVRIFISARIQKGKRKQRKDHQQNKMRPKQRNGKRKDQRFPIPALRWLNYFYDLFVVFQNIVE